MATRSRHPSHAASVRGRNRASNQATRDATLPSVPIPMPPRSTHRMPVSVAATTCPVRQSPRSSPVRYLICRPWLSSAPSTGPNASAVPAEQRPPGRSPPRRPPLPVMGRPCGPTSATWTRQHIPIARVAELLADTYGATVSTGVIVAMVQEGASMLEEFLGQVRELLCASDVVHADETGLRVEALLAWVHAASTTDLTLYHLDRRRGTKAMDAMGVVEHLRGVLVHDGWVPYRHYDNVTHALCNAHHLRELEAAGETDGQQWANDMAALLADTWHRVLEVKADGVNTLSDAELSELRTNYRAIIAAGHRANPPPIPTGKRGRPKRSKAHNLLMRLDTHADDVLRFATDFSVPFDNNLCERDVRMVKIAQKISGGFRSTEGAEAFLAFRSYLSTAAKQGVNRLGALQQLFNGDPWLPAQPGIGP